MKTFKKIKHFAFIALLGVIAGCSSDEPSFYAKNGSETSKPKFVKRTPEQAINLVRSLSENNQPTSRSDESSLAYDKVVDESSLQIIGTAISRSGEPSDTLIYAVNYSNNDGFVLVSANANTEPILAIVDNGSFDENRPTDNEAFEAYLNMAKGYVLNSGGGPRPPGPITPNPDHLTLMWKNDTISSFYCQKPRVEVRWGQDWPANIYCPNKVAGCAPLAVAQALTVTRTIDRVDLEFSERDVLWTALDWNDIIKHKSYPYLSDNQPLLDSHMNSCSSMDKSHKDIGRLARQLGVELKSVYHPKTPYRDAFTSTGISNFPPVLKKYFSGKTVVHSSNINSVYNNLNRIGSVAIVSGWNKIINADGSIDYIDGHTWIADASAHINRFVITYYNYDTVTGEYTHKESTQLQDDKFLHFNWGWNGLYDGYYLLNVFKPGMGHSTITKDMPSPSVREVDYYLALQDAYCIY